MFCNKNTVGETEVPSLLQKEKRRSEKSGVSKVLFPDIGKSLTEERRENETVSDLSYVWK